MIERPTPRREATYKQRKVGYTEIRSTVRTTHRIRARIPSTLKRCPSLFGNAVAHRWAYYREKPENDSANSLLDMNWKKWGYCE